MPELTTDFQSLPQEYQQVIRLAQDQHQITIIPLQLLVGGWSGAVVYLVSVSANDTKRDAGLNPCRTSPSSSLLWLWDYGWQKQSR